MSTKVIITSAGNIGDVHEVTLSPRELAQRWKMNVRTLANRRSLRKGPPFIRHGGRIAYRLADVIAFEEAGTVAAEESARD